MFCIHPVCSAGCRTQLCRMQLRLSRLPPLYNLLISPKANYLYSNACRVDRCKQLILYITRVKIKATLMISSISGTSPFAVPFSAISSDIVNSRNTSNLSEKYTFQHTFTQPSLFQNTDRLPHFSLVHRRRLLCS